MQCPTNDVSFFSFICNREDATSKIRAPLEGVGDAASREIISRP